MNTSYKTLAGAIATALTLLSSAPTLAADTGSSPKSANESAGPVGGANSNSTDRGAAGGSMQEKSKGKGGAMNSRTTPSPDNANETAGPSGGMSPKAASSMQNREGTGNSGSMGTRSGSMQDKDAMTKGAPKSANETPGPNNMAPK